MALPTSSVIPLALDDAMSAAICPTGTSTHTGFWLQCRNDSDSSVCISRCFGPWSFGVALVLKATKRSSWLFFWYLTGSTRRLLMSSSVSTSDGFAWLELDDFCPKLSVPCFDDIQEILWSVPSRFPIFLDLCFPFFCYNVMSRCQKVFRT